jgi:hypothetical protein
VANYPKTGQAVARYTGEWPDTRDPYGDPGPARGRSVPAPDGIPLILTIFDLDQHVFAGLKACASGFLLKDAPPYESGLITPGG